MKKKFTKLLIFASAGAILYMEQTAFAGDTQLFKSSNQLEQSQESQIPYTSERALQLKRASQLIGANVCNQQSEKIGDVRDLVIDLQSGHAPFAVFSSGGFFGVGGRLCAAPITAFKQSANEDELVLAMENERLKSAPSFDKNNWPDMTDQTWSAQVYSFYGVQPNWKSQSVASTSTVINEPAGAELSYEADAIRIYPGTYGETSLSPDRSPRKGLGAEDLMRTENPEAYAASDVFIHESAGAERTRPGVTTIEREEASTVTIQPGKIKRASELIGTEVKNAQNEHLGEIKDVVIDLKSGRVAYAVLSVGRFAGVEDKLYAVPPTVFTRSADEKWLVFNTDKETLKSAPSFEQNNWPDATDQKFTAEVYRFYHQQSYWQSSGELREPSGSERKMKMHLRDSRNSSNEWQRGNRTEDQYQQREIQEPSGGAAPSTQTSEAEIDEPAQTEPERSQSQSIASPKSLENQSQSSATKETAELQSSKQGEDVQEPAGATTESTATATSEDQASDSDRQLSKQVRTALEDDTVLSSTAPNVKVSSVNGKITLRGTVSSEQEKQAIAAKAQQVTGGADKVDNQLQVKSEPTNP